MENIVLGKEEVNHRWHYGSLPMCFRQVASMSAIPHLWNRSGISSFLVGLLSGLSDHLQKSSRAISKTSLELKTVFIFLYHGRVLSCSVYKLSTPLTALGNFWQVKVRDAPVGSQGEMVG